MGANDLRRVLSIKLQIARISNFAWHEPKSCRRFICRLSKYSSVFLGDIIVTYLILLLLMLLMGISIKYVLCTIYRCIRLFLTRCSHCEVIRLIIVIDALGAQL